jgi:hypothetical protein
VVENQQGQVKESKKKRGMGVFDEVLRRNPINGTTMHSLLSPAANLHFKAGTGDSVQGESIPLSVTGAETHE